MKKEKKVVLVLLVTIVILSLSLGYVFLSEAMKLKSCSLGEWWYIGKDIGGSPENKNLFISFDIFNPNSKTFSSFILEYYVLCGGELVHSGNIQKLYECELTTLHPTHNHLSQNFWVNSTDVSNSTWSSIQSGTMTWVVFGRLMIPELDDFYFEKYQVGW